MNKIKYINKKSCFIDKNTIFLGSATIGPNVNLIGNCIINDNVSINNSNVNQCEIGTNTIINKSELEHSKIGKCCAIGPYSHIRPDCIIDDNCKIGNFVEIKKSYIGKGTKISHLTYVGDAKIGSNVNIGCGVIFANYDGKNKHETTVGDNVFIGSNSNLIAPIDIEDNCFIAAGTTLTKSMAKNQFCIAREREVFKNNFNNPYSQKFIKNQNFHFGTDGIRIEGTNQDFYDLGEKFANALNGKKKIKVVIGRDTRKSGKFLVEGFLHGLTNAEIYDLSICPTPCIAYTTYKMNADFGIAFTASHNPSTFNGIKVFNNMGQKLSPNAEKLLDAKMQHDLVRQAKRNVKITKIKPTQYINNIIKNSINLGGLDVAIDVCGGATEKLAEKILTKLGANVHIIGRSKNHLINDNCGCLYMDHLKNYMLKNSIPVGFSFDGDGDRVLALDEKLNLVSGDNLLYVLAKNLKENCKLNNNSVVLTVMSNLSLIEKLKKLNINSYITPVGDKYVIEELNKKDCSLGGEQSGHIITKDVCGSGDGILVATQILKIMKENKQTLHNLSYINLYPQIQKSYTTNNAEKILELCQLNDLVNSCEKKLGNYGRIILRKSGTEPKIRLLVESKSKHLCKHIFEKLDKFIKNLC